MINLFLFPASHQLFRMASFVFYRVYPSGGVLRAKHVCGSGGRKLPPLSRGTREGRKSEARCKKSTADGKEKTK